MKRLAFSAVLAVCACTQPSPPETASDPRAGEPSLEAPTLPRADGAGNRMEALAQREDGAFCTADGAWCVTLGAPTRVTHHGARTTLPEFAEPAHEREIWDVIVRHSGDTNALVGVESRTHQMYSGGDAGARHVTLYDVSSSGAHAVLTIPTNGAAEIRACFNDADVTNRAEACSDLYAFVGQVSINTSVSQGAPRLVLETEAGTYPGRRSRSEDSTEGPALTAADLLWVADETCSYRRVATRAGDAYVWDQSLPECSDYLEP